MFDKLQLVRKSILLAYCLLISFFVCYFVHLLSFSEENELVKFTEEHIQEKNVCDPQSQSLFGSFFFKCFLAFFAGGLVSDRVFLKAGVI
jgi:dipeptide/tripeptide permease